VQSARRLLFAITLALLALPLVACDTPKPPPPREYILTSPYRGACTLAVAPVINQSGSREFDPLAVSDTLFAQLQLVDGLTVLPINKTLAAMQRLHMHSIESPQAAQQLAQAMGADAIVVAAVTAYDPYRPPTVGMVIQLYTAQSMAPVFTPAYVSEPVARQIGGNPLPNSDPTPPPISAPAPDALLVGQPVAQAAAMFPANNQTVLIELREFARGRTNYESALQEEQYLADSEAYMQFVCHAMVRRLIQVERTRMTGR